MAPHQGEEHFAPCSHRKQKEICLCVNAFPLNYTLLHIAEFPVSLLMCQSINKQSIVPGILVYFEVEVSYPPAVQVVKSLQNFGEVQRHPLLCEVAPAHNVVQETTLVGPAGDRSHGLAQKQGSQQRLNSNKNKRLNSCTFCNF